MDASSDCFLLLFCRMSMVPTLALILLYSAAWLSGILMDSCIRKTWCLFTFVIFAGIAFSFVVTLILTLAQHVFCHRESGSFACNINSTFFLCGQNLNHGYCQYEYITWVCAIAVIGAVIRTALPALGGDQVKEKAMPENISPAYQPLFKMLIILLNYISSKPFKLTCHNH